MLNIIVCINACVSVLQVQLAFKSITDEDLPLEITSNFGDKKFTFENFCCLLSEYRYHVS